MMRTPKNIGLATSFAERSLDGSLAGIQSSSQSALTLAEMTHDVFHHHDSTINDEAKVYRAEAHEVPGKAELQHACHGKKHSERNDQGHDKRRSPIPKQSEKDENDEQCPFDKISFHRLDGAVHEFAAVIELPNDDSSGSLA